MKKTKFSKDQLLNPKKVVTRDVQCGVFKRVENGCKSLDLLVGNLSNSHMAVSGVACL
jgi:hypothetical protein